MTNESFGSIIVAFILLTSVLIYLDISGVRVAELIVVLATILSIAYFIQPSDNQFET